MNGVKKLIFCLRRAQILLNDNNAQFLSDSAWSQALNPAEVMFRNFQRVEQNSVF